MGHAHSRTRYGPVYSQHLRPQGLYACHSVSHKQLKHLRHLILKGALAPCYPGSCTEADEARPFCSLPLLCAVMGIYLQGLLLGEHLRRSSIMASICTLQPGIAEQRCNF